MDYDRKIRERKSIFLRKVQIYPTIYCSLKSMDGAEEYRGVEYSRLV